MTSDHKPYKKSKRSLKQGSTPVTAEIAALIKKRLKEGVLQQRIASEFDVNAGRVSEINTGKRHAEVAPAE
jgi:hypothetical protein